MDARFVTSGLSFLKMHGAGNDFMIIDSRGRGTVVTPALVRALGDRNRGVGFDQLVEILDPPQGSPQDPQIDVTLTFWNADGSQSGACGNATRCVSDYILRDLTKTDMTLLTPRGILRAVKDPDGSICVNMGMPELDWHSIPLARDVPVLELPLPHSPVAVGMGNPHCVIFLPEVEGLDPSQLGPRYETDPLYPERTNVEFVSVLAPDRLRMRVWERGTGVTLACGSGACASVVAAHLRGLTGRRVSVDVDGGTLHVTWADDGVWMSGPVAYVFEGVCPPDLLAQHGVRV